MNTLSFPSLLSYFLVHAGAGPILWLVNIVIYLIVAVILWLILKWVAESFGVPPRIVQLIGLLLFLLLVLSLFVGCAGYESSVGSRSVGLSGSTAGDDAVNAKLIYKVEYR